MASPYAIYGLPSENMAGQATPTVTAGSTATGYGVANLTDGNPALPCQSTGMTLTLKWDFNVYGTPVLPTFAMLIATNLWQGSATLAGSADGITWDAATPFTFGVLDPDGYTPNAWLDLTGVTPRRYWRLVCANAVYVSIGQIWLGSNIHTVTHGHQAGSVREDGYPVLNLKTALGVEMVYYLGVRDQQVKTLKFVTSRGTGLANLQTLWRTARGRTEAWPLVIDPLLSYPDNAGMYVRFNQDTFDASILRGGQTAQVSLSVRALSPGLPLF